MEIPLPVLSWLGWLVGWVAFGTREKALLDFLPLLFFSYQLGLGTLCKSHLLFPFRFCRLFFLSLPLPLCSVSRFALISDGKVKYVFYLRDKWDISHHKKENPMFSYKATV